MIRAVMNVLAGIVRLYSLLILIRVILSWFGTGYGRPAEILARITDPYLNWWRRFTFLRLGFLDLSPIAAMAALSVVQTVFSTIAVYGTISLKVILAVCLSALWSAVSFLLGFCFVILLLRLIACITNMNTYSGFWQNIDTVSRPILYRIQRIIFGRRLINYLTGIIVSTAVLLVLWIGGGFLVRVLAGLLVKAPV